MEAVVIQADGESFTIHLNQKMKLEQYQKIVGGYIEVVQVRHDGKVCDMVLNEDGLGLGLPLNLEASLLLETYWRETIGPPEDRMPPNTVGRVVGDVVVLHGCRL